MLYPLLTLFLTSSLALSKPVRTYGAVYSMTNDPTGNFVVINSIGSDGLLTYHGVVPTGGTGLHGVAPGVPPEVDPLSTQHSIRVVGNHMFLVNPGSNSISMFSINPSNPLEIKVVGKPVSSGGQFPGSIAVSKNAKNVCVLNGGKKNGVQCFDADPTHGLRPRGKFHDLGLNLTIPTPLPDTTVSDILFTPDEKQIRVAVKGFTTTNAPGFVATWDVDHNGDLSKKYVKTVPGTGDGVFPFGMFNIVGNPNGVMVTDPGLGLTVYDFSHPKTVFHPLVIPGQIATCWADYSKVTNSYWTSDLNANRVYEVAVDPRSLKPTLLNTFQLGVDNYPIEVVIASVLGKDYFYVLSPRVSSMNIFALKKGGSKHIDTYNFGKLIKGIKFTPTNLVGAAAYVL